MAATIQTKTRVGDRLAVGNILIITGSGAIVAADALVTDVKAFPPGTVYIDVTNNVTYQRIGKAAAIGDWYKPTLTQHS